MDMNEPTANRSGAANSGRAVIYVVDDEPMLLELASVILDPLGYRIKTFRSPEAAIQDFRSAQPQPVLIITDYAMHTMNGLELIEACRRIQPGQKALLLSGTMGPDICHNAPTQPDRFLAKPYQAKQLLDVVRSLLAG
jgi:CheY-like chemotaxis protein